MRLFGAALGVAAITSAAGVITKLGPQRWLFVAGLLISGAASIAFSNWYVLSGRAHALLPSSFDVQVCFSDFGEAQGPPGCVAINYTGPNLILYGGIVILVSAIITAIRIRMRPDREVHAT